MWCDPADFQRERTITCSKSEDPSVDRQWILPIAVLDMRPPAVEEMVERAAKACFEVGFRSGEVWEDAAPMMKIAARIEAEAALTAILGPLPTASRAKRG